MSTNEKTSKDYWNERVIEAKEDPQALVYASAGKLQKSQEVGDHLISLFVKPGQTVLDVGCGYGRYYAAVRTVGAQYHGIDFSEEMIKLAKKKFPLENFTVADWRTFEGRDFDVVFASICRSSTDLSIDEYIQLLKVFARDKGTIIVVEPEFSGAVTKDGNLFD